MRLPALVYRWIGKRVADKLDLQEDSKMDGTKPWYKSQTLWSDILTIVTLCVGVADTHFGTHIASTTTYATILSGLALIGIHGRYTAAAKIG